MAYFCNAKACFGYFYWINLKRIMICTVIFNNI